MSERQILEPVAAVGAVTPYVTPRAAAPLDLFLDASQLAKPLLRCAFPPLGRGAFVLARGPRLLFRSSFGSRRRLGRWGEWLRSGARLPCFAAQIVFVVADVAGRVAGSNLDDLVGKLVEEMTVVRHQDQRSRVALQCF